jgi:hypothetical protein
VIATSGAGFSAGKIVINPPQSGKTCGKVRALKAG